MRFLAGDSELPLAPVPSLCGLGHGHEGRAPSTLDSLLHARSMGGRGPLAISTGTRYRLVAVCPSVLANIVFIAFTSTFPRSAFSRWLQLRDPGFEDIWVRVISSLPRVVPSTDRRFNPVVIRLWDGIKTANRFAITVAEQS